MFVQKNVVQVLDTNYCLHWESVWYATLINDRNVFKVKTRHDLQSLSFGRYVSVVESSARFSHVAPRTIGTKNCVYDVCLRILRRSKLRNRELLLWGDERFVYNCNVMFFEDACQELCLSSKK